MAKSQKKPGGQRPKIAPGEGQAGLRRDTNFMAGMRQDGRFGEN